MRKAIFAVTGLVLVSLSSPIFGYPLYGSEDRGIRRLEGTRLEHEGVVAGKEKPPGELLSVEEVDLRLLDNKSLELPAPDPGLSAKIRDLLGANINRYAIAVLDLTNPAEPVYAEINGLTTSNPGSVGKIVAVTGLFQALADTYPDSIEKRLSVLRDTMITADDFILTDSHTVRFWDAVNRKMNRRPLQIGDQGTLWEYLDWMMSASSNAAASTVMKQAMLINHFRERYPVSDEEGIEFFKSGDKDYLADLYEQTFQGALTRNGINTEQLRQGRFFTATAKTKVRGKTNSVASPRELMHFLVRLEQGRIVDEFSSREIKRLLYMTERRIRYASSPALADSAVYFKSGSLYACQPEEGYTCKKYQGNKENYMNSIAIVESPAKGRRMHYIVTLMSNVLKKNSAVDHQTMATRVHRIMEKAHPN